MSHDQSLPFSISSTKAHFSLCIKVFLKLQIFLITTEFPFLFLVAPNVTSLTPVSQFKGDGEKAYLTCVTTGVPSVNITWKRRDGKPVRGKITTIGFTSVLKIRRLESSDTGYYHCVAENRAGKSEKSAFLKVKGQLLFLMLFLLK